MKKIQLIDDTFLRLESRNQPLHIGMLMLFEPSANAPEDFAARIVRKFRQSETATGIFNQRLVEKRGAHYWEQNDDFDLDHHFVHLALPRPGRIRELLDMVSRLHCGHLDRAYPLWRIHLIEGIEGGSFAIYLKIHHSMIDGMGGIEMLVNSMSTSRATSKKMPPFWEIERASKDSGQFPAAPPPAATGRDSISAAARGGWRSAMPVIHKLRKTFKDFEKKNPDVAMAGEAPRCIFNQPISGTRRFAAQSYPTPRIKSVARALGGTSNDVILGMVSGALRKYLEARDEFPEMPLTAGLPVSLRSKNSDGSAANELGFVIANLATNIDDPVERTRAIKRSMDYNKAQISGLSPRQVQAYGSLSLIPGAVNVLMGRKPENSLGNVCVSHVPGPKNTLYWQGAKLTGVYPISLLVGAIGLNITVISRHDTVDFGIIACRKTVPHAQHLLAYLEEALSELEAGISGADAPPEKSAKAKTKAKKAAPRKKAAPKKKSTAKAKVKVKAKAKAKAKPRRS